VTIVTVIVVVAVVAVVVVAVAVNSQRTVYLNLIPTVTRARDWILKRRTTKIKKHIMKNEKTTIQYKRERERERESTVNGTNRTYKEVEGHFKYNVELQ
jgi:hypothetical protein